MSEPIEESKGQHALLGSLSRYFKPHPWHGVTIGDDAPKIVNTYIEIVPTDTVKFEMDKLTGYLQVDRPQKYSNICPSLYGLIPQTYCAEEVAEYCMQQTQRGGLIGDGDPLDICVLTEKDFSHGDVLLKAIPIGGLRMIDGGTVDDKIVAVLKGDGVYGTWLDIRHCPEMLINRLKHYFLTYKDAPDTQKRICEITHIYGAEEAYEVIERSRRDYARSFSYLRDHLKGSGLV